ncbi:transglycosylase SLT domain-containing protein [Dyella sp. 2RAB6]
MLTGLEMMACQNLAVPAEVMQHVVNVESSSNPFAIGVVGGQLVRQPQNLDEAIATVQMLESKGYNFSVGLAQVNRTNFGKYGLDTYEKAFSMCGNLGAGSRILAGCYASAGGDWGKAFSCYYSGNFTTGYRDGYVQKIYDSMGRGMRLASNSTPVAQAIPLQTQVQPQAQAQVQAQGGGRRVAPVVNTQIDDASYRVALRSVAIDTAANVAVSALANRLGMQPQQPVNSQPLPQGMPANGQAVPQGVPYPNVARTMQQAMPSNGQMAPQGVANTMQGQADDNQPIMAGVVGGAPSGSPAANPAAPGDGVFTPQVRGPNDRAPQTSAQSGQAAGATMAPGPDRADMRQGGRDAALVF